MSKSHSWGESLEMGLNAEEFVVKRLNQGLSSEPVESVDYADDPDAQRNGIDARVENPQIRIDVKTQAFKYAESGILPFETWSATETASRGWMYASHADVLVWVFQSAPGSDEPVYHRGWLIKRDLDLIEWFLDRRRDYRKIEHTTYSQSREWTTRCRLVPIEDIPDGHIQPFDVRFPGAPFEPELVDFFTR